MTNLSAGFIVVVRNQSDSDYFNGFLKKEWSENLYIVKLYLYTSTKINSYSDEIKSTQTYCKKDSTWPGSLLTSKPSSF